MQILMNYLWKECLYYNDEPGLSESAKEQLFKEEVLQTYNLLIIL